MIINFDSPSSPSLLAVRDDCFEEIIRVSKTKIKSYATHNYNYNFFNNNHLYIYG